MYDNEQNLTMYCARGHKFSGTMQDAAEGTDKCPECSLHGHFYRQDAEQEAAEILEP